MRAPASPPRRLPASASASASAALAACLALSGCFGEVGFAAANTAAIQAAAAKNATGARDDALQKINESLALQAARNAQLLSQAQQQAEGPEPSPDVPR